MIPNNRHFAGVWFLLLVAGVPGVVGCDGCGSDGDSLAMNGSAQFQLAPLPEQVPPVGAVYQEAYDRALGQITSDNARQRLREIERSIIRERRELPREKTAR